MPHLENSDDHGSPTQLQKTAASLAAGIVIAIGQIVYSIFKLVFSILSALA